MDHDIENKFFSRWLLVFNMNIGGGSVAMGPVSGNTAVSSVFKEKKGLAIGVGGFIFFPLIGGWLLPQFGWQGAFIGIAAAHFLLIPLALLILKKRDKKDLQQMERQPCQSAEIQKQNIWTGIFSARFFLISIAFFLLLFSIVGTVQSQAPHLQDIGFPVLAASPALGALGLISSFAKLFFGWLCDQIHPKIVFCFGALFLIAGIGLPAVVKQTSSPVVLWSYAVNFGIGVGCWLPIMSMMVSAIFGIASYGLIFGGVSLIQKMGSATGPLAAGLIYDLTKSCNGAFMLFLALTVLSVTVVLGVRPPRRAGEPESRLLSLEGDPLCVKKRFNYKGLQ